MEKPCEAKGSSWKIIACLHPPGAVFTGAVQLQPCEHAGPSPAATGPGWFQQLSQSSGSRRGVQLPGRVGPELAQPVLWSTREANPADGNSSRISVSSRAQALLPSPCSGHNVSHPPQHRPAQAETELRLK